MPPVAFMKEKANLLQIGIFFLSSIIIVFLWIKFQRQHSFNFDSQNKVYQSYSLVMNGFRSEALVYPGQDIDPERVYDPIPWKVVLEDGRQVSAFPVAFSLLVTPFVFIDRELGYGLEYSALLNLLPLLGIWVLLLRWDLSTPVLLMAYWGNFLWLQVFELSEYLVAAFLSFSGYTLFIKTESRSRGDLYHLLAGMLLGLAIFFRHEAIAFGLTLIGSALLVILVPQLRGKDVSAINIRRTGFYGAGFGFILSLWGLWNAIDYGHPLGPRFLVSKHTVFLSLQDTLWRYRVLYFGGGLKFGLFAFLPLLSVPLLKPIVQFLRNPQSGFGPDRTSEENITLIAILVYLVGVPLFVPNDGAGGFGPRYLIFAVLPGIILIQRWVEEHPSHRKNVLVLIVTLISFILPVFLHRVQKQGTVQQSIFHADYKKTRADIWIFPHLSLYYYAGLDTIRYESYLASNDEGLFDLVERLQRARPGRSIAIVSLSDQFVQAAEANLAGKNSEVAKESLNIVRKGRINIESIRQRYPQIKHIRGVQADVWLLAPVPERL